MNLAIDTFASHADKSLINYIDFCSACERAESFSRVVDGDKALSGSRSDKFVYGSGYDGVSMRSREFDSENERWVSDRYSSTLDDEDAYNRRGNPGSTGRPPLSRSNMSLGRSGGLSSPGISASQVGSKQWGNFTPLSQKGRPLSLGGDSWACSICLYTNNPMSGLKCIVCDSADYSKKQKGVNGTCKNCRFANDFGARDCEMCGLPV